MRTIYFFVKENLYWIILAVALALMLWLAPKVNATPLDDYMAKYKLVLPLDALIEIKRCDLIVLFGVENTRDKIFTVYVFKKNDIPPPPLMADIHRAVMEIKFYFVKQKIVIEYEKEIGLPQPAKCWPSFGCQIVVIFKELFPM